MLQIATGEVDLTFPFLVNPVTFDFHIFPVFFGGTVLSAERHIISVSAIQMGYFAVPDTKRQDERYVMV